MKAEFPRIAAQTLVPNEATRVVFGREVNPVDVLQRRNCTEIKMISIDTDLNDNPIYSLHDLGNRNAADAIRLGAVALIGQTAGKDRILISLQGEHPSVDTIPNGVRNRDFIVQTKLQTNNGEKSQKFKIGLTNDGYLTNLNGKGASDPFIEKKKSIPIIDKRTSAYLLSRVAQFTVVHP